MDKCFYCGEKLKAEKVNIARFWGKKLIALNDVPALICQKCGERFFEAKVSAKVDEKLQQILNNKISYENTNVPQVQY